MKKNIFLVVAFKEMQYHRYFIYDKREGKSFFLGSFDPFQKTKRMIVN